MRKILLIVGIISVISCVLALLFAALNWYGYYHVLDGTAELYSRLRRRMVLFSVIGSGLAVVGIVCFIIRSKI